VDIDLKSFRFTTVPNHDSMQPLSLVENMSRIWPFQNLFRAEKFRSTRCFAQYNREDLSFEGTLNFLSQSLVDWIW